MSWFILLLIAGALALETRIGYFFRERKEVMCSDRQYA